MRSEESGILAAATWRYCLTSSTHHTRESPEKFRSRRSTLGQFFKSALIIKANIRVVRRMWRVDAQKDVAYYSVGGSTKGPDHDTKTYLA